MATKQSKTLEATLWDAADKLRGNLEAAEYKHVVLGLVFLKYVSDAFEFRRKTLEEAIADPGSCEYIKDAERRQGILESRDEYISENVFWIGAEARWHVLQGQAKQPEIGVLIDRAMDIIERDNPTLKGVLPKTYARPEIDKRLLGELVDLIGAIGFREIDHGTDDVLGRVYEYFLGRFAASEGRGAGEFYTPRSVVQLLVELLQPYRGRVFDPCCGSGGMFVQSDQFVTAHGGRRTDISIYGQEFVASTWRLAKMNLAIRGIEANLGDESADSFYRDLFPDLRADFILANPPFNDSDWYRNKGDPRWQYGVPPASNANFAWVQHFIHHLEPSGRAGFILANMALTSESADESAIRQGMIEEGLVECVVTLPDRLFYSTPIPVSIWILDKQGAKGRREVLLIDASRLGTNLSRTIKALEPSTITKIASTYQAWRDRNRYEDERGYCRSVHIEDIISADYKILPASYVLGTDPLVRGTGNIAGSLTSPIAEAALNALLESADLQSDLDELIVDLRARSQDLRESLAYKTVILEDILERSLERLGNDIEPEVLTCTEVGGLILQRERFAKRVATKDASKYKVVRRGDIVYNPYLLWKGSIDQCWIVDLGITSPAYEVFTIRNGWHRSIIGEIITSSEMIRRYDGISFGTVQRRRRASPENFLAMEVQVPVGDAVEELGRLLELARACQFAGRKTERSFKEFVSDVAREIS